MVECCSLFHSNLRTNNETVGKLVNGAQADEGNEFDQRECS